MTKNVGIRKPVIPVPRSLEKAAEFLSQIAEKQRAIDAIQSELNAKVDELKTEALLDVRSHQEMISQLVEGLFVFAESNREELTDNGKRKTVEVPTGWFGWRMTPPVVSISNVKSVLKSLKELGLKRFIRTKEEPNKKAMLEEPEVAKTVKGVSIAQHEEFVIKPAELEIEIPSNVNKLKKAVS